MARPRKELPPETEKGVEDLSAEGCTQEEIAVAVGVDVTTLNRRFRDAIVSGKLRGNVSVKRKLYELCMSGNLGAIIWWGKQNLGWTDRLDQRTEVKEVTTYKVGWADDKPTEANPSEAAYSPPATDKPVA